MADLIFSRSLNDTPLTDAQIFRMAPAAYSETQADHLSSRYGQVTTANAIDMLRDSGFSPVQAAQVKSRKGSSDHAAHLVAFAPNNGGDIVRGTRGEIILYNSHDGRSSLKLFAGAYRFICSNGIVAGEGFDAKLRHTKGTSENFEDMLRDVAGNLPDVMERIETMGQNSVSASDAIDFAYNAANLRWEWMDAESGQEPEKSGAYATRDTLVSLLRPTRQEDKAQDAWTIFNRVQEGLIRGGSKVRSYSDRNPHGKTRRSRPIGSVSGVVKTNRELWDLAADCGLV